MPPEDEPILFLVLHELFMITSLRPKWSFYTYLILTLKSPLHFLSTIIHMGDKLLSVHCNDLLCQTHNKIDQFAQLINYQYVVILWHASSLALGTVISVSRGVAPLWSRLK